ncbi:hypothetical protein D3C77_662160 [compost metagenome]
MDLTPHVIERGGQFTQFVGLVRIACGNRLGEVAGPETTRAIADDIQRPEQAPHV